MGNPSVIISFSPQTYTRVAEVAREEIKMSGTWIKTGAVIMYQVTGFGCFQLLTELAIYSTQISGSLRF